MATFKFVNIKHPRDIKDRKQQRSIRSHALRTSFKKIASETIKNESNFIAVEADASEGKLIKRKIASSKSSIPKGPSAGLLDPFGTLPGSPERLRSLIRHESAQDAGEPVISIGNAGKFLFLGMDTVFAGALSDPALFHSLSLILALAANMNMPNTECLSHRGAILASLGERMKDPQRASQVSTLSAMLLLIGYEYRIDGSNASSIAMHIRAVDSILKMNRKNNTVVPNAMKRALFWQDLFSCLFAGTMRFFSHKDFPELRHDRSRSPVVLTKHEIPGFIIFNDYFRPDFTTVLEDLNALCAEVDYCYHIGEPPIAKIEIDNAQAWIESRLIDLLSNKPAVSAEDTIYEASILAAFLSTYKLSTVIWQGCFIPEYVAGRIVGLLSRLSNISHWDTESELLTWLLFIGGGLAVRADTRSYCAKLILGPFDQKIGHLHQSWESTKMVLRKFPWSKYIIEPRAFSFWAEVHSEASGFLPHPLRKKSLGHENSASIQIRQVELEKDGEFEGFDRWFVDEEGR